MAMLIFAFIAYALSTGKEQFAIEAIKVIAYVTAGGLGGYGMGKHRATHKQIDSDRNDD